MMPARSLAANCSSERVKVARMVGALVDWQVSRLVQLVDSATLDQCTIYQFATLPTYNGIFPCFFGGLVSRLFCSIPRALIR